MTVLATFKVERDNDLGEIVTSPPKQARILLLPITTATIVTTGVIISIIATMPSLTSLSGAKRYMVKSVSWEVLREQDAK